LSLLAGLGQELRQASALGGGRRLQEVNQHQRPLPFPEVAGELLAVAFRVSGEVEPVVLDLEGGAEEESEADEAVEIGSVAGADEGADAARVDGRTSRSSSAPSRGSPLR
jgi:hypothetical protein